jgi:hypothetical protein
MLGDRTMGRPVGILRKKRGMNRVKFTSNKL